MKHGRIVEHGTYRELLARGVDFHAEVEEGQPQQHSETAMDAPDDGEPVAEMVQGSPAAANGVREPAQAQQPVQASSPEHSGGQEAKEAKTSATPSAELAKGDLTKVLRERPCCLIASSAQDPCLPGLC